MNLSALVVNRFDLYVVLGVAALLYVAGVAKDKLPSTAAIHDLVALLDTKGGNILVLLALSGYFFHRTELMYYHIMELVRSDAIAADNGVALNALLFASTAFGGVSGALLKVMSGNEPAFRQTQTKPSPPAPLPAAGAQPEEPIAVPPNPIDPPAQAAAG